MILAILDKLLSLCGVKTKTVYAPPLLGGIYRDELARYSDAELIARDRDAILAEIRAGRRQKVGTR